jgi:hypothetical protein
MEKIEDINVDDKEKEASEIEAPSWNRRRSEEELGRFIARREAILKDLNIEL